MTMTWCWLLCLCTFDGAANSPVDRESKLEVVTEELEFPDGPAWDGQGALHIPDVRKQQLNRWVVRRNQLVRGPADAARNSATFYNHGALFAADNGAGRISRMVGKKTEFLNEPMMVDQKLAKPNDLVVDRYGRVYYTLTRQAMVARIDHNGKTSVVVRGIETPNGLVLSPDESTLYVASYVPKKIWAYQVDQKGNVGEGHLFGEMDDGPERGADGMAIDRAGNVYCAGASDIWIWNPEGQLLDKIKVPQRPINCTFGDQDMRTLYIVGGGTVYRQRMRISGKPPHPPADPKRQSTQTQRPPTTIPKNIQAHLDVVYGADGSRKLLVDIFQPEGEKLRPAIVVVHGGGWLKGDKTKFRALAVELARRGYVTAAVEYRLGDEARFPAGIQDCLTCVRFLRANAEKYGIAAERIGAVGGSAGGHLVGLMAAAGNVDVLQGTSGHADQSSQIQTAIVMAGPMQMISGSVADRSRKQPGQSNSNRWLGKTVDEAPDLYRLADAYEQLSKETPPILFMVGEHDQPQRNQPSRDKLKELGVWTGLKVYEDGKHGCWNQLPWFDTMVADMDEFFEAQLR